MESRQSHLCTLHYVQPCRGPTPCATVPCPFTSIFSFIYDSSLQELAPWPCSFCAPTSGEHICCPRSDNDLDNMGLKQKLPLESLAGSVLCTPATRPPASPRNLLSQQWPGELIVGTAFLHLIDHRCPVRGTNKRKVLGCLTV